MFAQTWSAGLLKFKQSYVIVKPLSDLSVFRSKAEFLSECHFYAGSSAVMRLNSDWFSRAKGMSNRSDGVGMGYRLQQLKGCQGLGLISISAVFM